MDHALAQLHVEGTHANLQDVARRSSLGYAHLTFPERYSFAFQTISSAVAIVRYARRTWMLERTTTDRSRGQWASFTRFRLTGRSIAPGTPGTRRWIDQGAVSAVNVPLPLGPMRASPKIRGVPPRTEGTTVVY